MLRLVLAIAIVLCSRSVSEAGKPIIGCCEKANNAGSTDCGNIHNSLEQLYCGGGLIQGTYKAGLVCKKSPGPGCEATTTTTPKDQDDGSRNFTCVGIPINQEGGILSCSSTNDEPGLADTLWIPEELGGGAIVTEDFQVDLVIGYEPSADDEELFMFSIQVFEATAPSVVLPIPTNPLSIREPNKETGPNTVSATGGIGIGSWDSRTKAVVGSFSTTIVNDLFTEQSPLYSFPSLDGTFDDETGIASLAWKANVFWPDDSLPTIMTAVSEEVSISLPEVPKLLQNYPNPFNSTTTIRFDMPYSGSVKVSIFDLSGQLVRTLADVYLRQGSHHMTWSGLDNRGGTVASGVYVCQVSTGSGWTESRRMVLLK